MSEHVFTVPMLPPASQSPNARCHWTKKRADRRAFMEVCALAILGAGGKDWRFERVQLEAVFVVPTSRRRDADNAIASLKGCLDTIVQMGLLADDDWEHCLGWVRVGWTVDRAKAPATVVTIVDLGK